jgi:glycosyltransferase involved in cell wall biosynthesis
MKPRIHILFEHGADGQPYGSAQIRLLRPLTHPALCDEFDVTSGLDYAGQAVEAVILDRLWRPDISLALAGQLVAAVQHAGAKLIYTLDDNFLDLPPSIATWFTPQHRQVVEFFLSQADGVMVTTPGLKDRFAPYNQNIVVVAHALDERLLKPKPRAWLNRFRSRRIIIGYMGTFSHDDDLLMIAPALRAAIERHSVPVEIRLIGVAERPATLAALSGLPVRVIALRPEMVEYTRFLPWFTQQHWDIALAPLIDSRFTRCKSDIKFLDYSALGAAGIYSRVPAYESSVRHLETGWVTDNTIEAWQRALEELISSNDLRRDLAQRAAHYLFAERILKQRARNWLAALTQLIGGEARPS